MRLPSTVVIHVLPVHDPDSFERLSLAERADASAWTREFVSHSRWKPDSFLLRAADVDLGVFTYGAQDIDNEMVETVFIDGRTLIESRPVLEKLLGDDAEKTAVALAQLGKEADVARVRAALRSGEWPTEASIAVEAAAFGRQLL